MASRPLTATPLRPRLTASSKTQVCLSARRSCAAPVSPLADLTPRQHGRSVCVAMATGSPKDPGGNVIDKPTTLPGIDLTKEAKRKKPPMYKVLLHNDSNNRREYVVKVLLKIVDGLTVDDAVNVMNEAHIHGLALVIACAMADAERYTNGLRSNGLVATMEPDS